MARQVALAAQPQPVVWTEDSARTTGFLGGVYYETQATASYSLTAGSGSFALSGQAVAFVTVAPVRQLIIASQPVPLLVTTSTDRVVAYGSTLVVESPPISGARTITAQTGSFVLTGQAANLAKAGFTADSGTFMLGVQAATLARGYKLSASRGAFTYTLAGVIRTLEAFTGSFGLSGQAAELIYAPSTTTLVAAGGLFTLSGQDAGLARDIPFEAEYSTFSLAGQSVEFTISNRSLPAEPGVFVLYGGPTGNHLRAEAGLFGLTGVDAALELNADTFWTRVDEVAETWTKIST